MPATRIRPTLIRLRAGQGKWKRGLPVRGSMSHSKTALGAHYRRIARRLGPDVAVFVTARKLAHHIYRLPRWGKPYVDEGEQAYQRRYQQARLKYLAATAKDFGYELVSEDAKA